MSSVAKIAILVTALAASAQAALQINTPPSLVECQPAQIAWTDGEKPFFVAVIPGGDPSGTPLKQFPQTDSSPIQWSPVDIAEGTKISLSITDGTGQPAFSSEVTIGKGVSTSCLSGNSSSSSSSSSASSGSSGSSSAASAGSSSSAASSAKPSSGTTNSASSGSSSDSSSAAPAAGSSGASSDNADSGASSLVKSSAAVLAIVGAAALLA